MTIPHQQDEVSELPVTYDQASQRYGPGRLAARERYDELSMREHLSRAYAKLKASGQYDPAKHGTGDTEPLTGAEHLELLATAEYLARAYKPHGEVDQALRAGATWRQVAEALGTDEAMARVEYRAWADGQHDMLRWTDGRLGMSDADYGEVLVRAGEPDPGAAKAYAATHRVLCAHADQDGRGTHWLAPREKCEGSAMTDREEIMGIDAPAAAGEFARTAGYNPGPEVDDPDPSWLYDLDGHPAEYAGEPEAEAGQ